jgi:hypothetical protein
VTQQAIRKLTLMSIKKQIHVNQHIIKKNRKTGERNPVLTIKTYKSNVYASEIEGDGKFRVIYRPDQPLACGAQVWIECDGDVTVIR